MAPWIQNPYGRPSNQRFCDINSPSFPVITTAHSLPCLLRLWLNGIHGTPPPPGAFRGLPLSHRVTGNALPAHPSRDTLSNRGDGYRSDDLRLQSSTMRYIYIFLHI